MFDKKGQGCGRKLWVSKFQMIIKNIGQKVLYGN